MALSIITPHYNDLEGLKRVHNYLLDQTVADWEWIIIDDMSQDLTVENLKSWHRKIDDTRLHLICNQTKANASVCRNQGADTASHDHLVFLDSDDKIANDFVANRNIEFKDFAVLKNTAIIDQNGKISTNQVTESHYLNNFLSARFIWPITAIVWKKTFFNSIGKFHPELPRLQDIELAIRALQISNDYLVLDNKVDFYYNVKPIRSRKNFVKPVCKAVSLFIKELLNVDNLSKDQKRLLSGYYFLCVRYFERSGNVKDSNLVFTNLKLFFEKKYISLVDYIIGFIALKLYTLKLISGGLFLRINRRVFKPVNFKW